MNGFGSRSPILKRDTKNDHHQVGDILKSKDFFFQASNLGVLLLVSGIKDRVISPLATCAKKSPVSSWPKKMGGFGQQQCHKPARNRSTSSGRGVPIFGVPQVESCSPRWLKKPMVGIRGSFSFLLGQFGPNFSGATSCLVLRSFFFVHPPPAWARYQITF